MTVTQVQSVKWAQITDEYGEPQLVMITRHARERYAQRTGRQLTETDIANARYTVTAPGWLRGKISSDKPAEGYLVLSHDIALLLYADREYGTCSLVARTCLTERTLDPNRNRRNSRRRRRR